MKDRTKKGLQDLLLLLAGTLLLAFAVKCIYEPLDMVTGGFSGLAILKDICRKVFCCDDPVVTLAVYPAGMESGRG